MSLEEKLEAIRTGAAARIPAELRAIMNQATADLRASGIMDGVIKVGDRLPAFALTNQEGVPVSSDAILARGPMVMTVFRGVW